MQGWAWADVEPAIEDIALAMERTTPTDAELALAESISSLDSDRVAAQRNRDAQSEEAAVRAALRFWPPV